jgi:hypothetical protein
MGDAGDRSRLAVLEKAFSHTPAETVLDRMLTSQRALGQLGSIASAQRILWRLDSGGMDARTVRLIEDGFARLAASVVGGNLELNGLDAQVSEIGVILIRDRSVTAGAVVLSSDRARRTIHVDYRNNVTRIPIFPPLDTIVLDPSSPPWTDDLVSASEARTMPAFRLLAV